MHPFDVRSISSESESSPESICRSVQRLSGAEWDLSVKCLPFNLGYSHLSLVVENDAGWFG